MKYNDRFVALAVTSLLLAACQKELKDASAEGPMAEHTTAGLNKGTAGQVYTLSNGANANEVLVYNRTAGGQLSFADAYATGGAGTGSGLGSQGAVTLSEDNRWLLAVNAGSNSVSSFRVTDKTLQLVSTVSSGGTTPKSVTVYNNLVYVLNAGGSGNISGFQLESDGTLEPLAGSTRPLSSAASDPAQVSFTSDGSAMVVTEKATNTIVSYIVTEAGTPGAMHLLASANATPFGFVVGGNGIIYVSEAAGGAPGASTVSAYQVSSSGVISLVDGPVSAGQTAACWVVVTNNGKYVYATNTGSHTVSAFRADNSGDLSVLEAAIPTAPGLVPIDAALSVNSRFLYVLNSGTESIGVFTVDNDGSLAHIMEVTGLPDGAVGLAAK
jgi:6-phosphogluconolactonase